MTGPLHRVRRAAAELSSSQGGLFTPHQILAERIHATAEDVTAAIQTLSLRGEISQVTGPVFFHNAHASSTWTLARARWMLVNPRLTNIDQLHRWADGNPPAAVIGGAAAARAWQIDSMVMPDLLFAGADTLDGQEGRREPRSTIDRQDIRWTEDHFPITGVERTLADGLRLDGDWTHVADALRDALWDRYALDLTRLRSLVDAVAAQDNISDLAPYVRLLDMAGGLPTQPGLQYGDRRWIRTL